MTTETKTQDLPSSRIIDEYMRPSKVSSAGGAWYGVTLPTTIMKKYGIKKGAIIRILGFEVIHNPEEVSNNKGGQPVRVVDTQSASRPVPEDANRQKYQAFSRFRTQDLGEMIS